MVALSLTSFVWILVTAFLGLLSSGRVALSSFPDTHLWHPYWGLATLPPIFLLHLISIRNLGKSPPSVETREAALRGYAAILGMAASTLAGLGAMMGFLPPLFHQIAAWPLVLFLVWGGIRCLRKRP